MEFVKVESSQIDSVGFGDGEFGPETLGVRFKNKPEYPFVKVEAETTVIRDDGKVILNNIDLETDALNPSSALAEIDTLKPEFIFVPGNIDLILVKLRDEVLEMAKGLDPSTPAKQKRIREIKGLVVSRRTFIEKVRVGYVADLVLKKGMTDTVSKAVQGRLSSIEDEILKVTGYSAWEQGEKEIKAKNDKIVSDINAMQPHIYPTIDSLILAIAQLNAIDTDSMRELSALASGCKKQRLELLTEDLVKRQDAEAERLELERLRAESAARAEADRLAEQQRQEQARIDAAVEAAKEATRQEVIAELAAPVVEIPAPVDDMPVTTVKSLPITGMVETREQRFHREAVAGLTGFASIDRQSAIRVLTAITKGQVPHVTIGY